GQPHFRQPVCMGAEPLATPHPRRMRQRNVTPRSGTQRRVIRRKWQQADDIPRISEYHRTTSDKVDLGMLVKIGYLHLQPARKTDVVRIHACNVLPTCTRYALIESPSQATVHSIAKDADTGIIEMRHDRR